MNKTIKLSENAQKACEILQRIEKLVKEYRELFDGLAESREGLLVGGIVMGIYSPVGDVGSIASVCNSLVGKGLRVLINENLDRRKPEDKTLESLRAFSEAERLKKAIPT